jgi:hypothetical protein
MMAAAAIATSVRTIRFPGTAQPLNAQMVRFDIFVFSLMWKFLCLGGGMPGYDVPFLLVVLVLNIICNLVMRSSEENVGRALPAAPVAGTVFSIGLFAVMAAIVFGLVRLFATGARSAADTFFAAMRSIIGAFFAMLGRFFEWLASFLPRQEFEGQFEMPPGETAQADSIIEPVNIPEEVLYIAAAVLGAIIIAGAVYLVIRFRKARFYAGSPGRPGRMKPVNLGRSAGRLRSRILSILRKIVFAIKSIRYLNTPQGTLVYLERWGRKRGMARTPGQSMRGYLMSLSQLLEPIADDLDAMYFGSGIGSLTKADCRRMRQDFRKKNRNRTAMQ